MRLLTSLALGLLSVTAPARAAHSFHVEDMQRLSRVSGLKLSPDGKWVAFVVSRSDLAKNRSVKNIWMVSANGAEAQQMTFAQEGSNDRPRWSPDSRHLYFSARVSRRSRRSSGWPSPAAKPNRSPTFQRALPLTSCLQMARRSRSLQACFLSART